MKGVINAWIALMMVPWPGIKRHNITHLTNDDSLVSFYLGKILVHVHIISDHVVYSGV